VAPISRTARATGGWVAVFFLLSTAGLAQDLIGRASIIDGDTIELHGTRIRIHGIDAPESTQLCRGADSLQYRCGAQAANKLADFIEGRAVSCRAVGVDRYSRTIATCSADGADLGEWLVQNGLALDWPKYSGGKYQRVQLQAEGGEAGMWSGSFAEPWRFRDCRRAGGSIPICSDQYR
jgi:endonuclease YncB( thermonuclease family)